MVASSLDRTEVQNTPSETVLPEISELFIDERDGECLILNPVGPWWFIGSRLHASFLELCDGKRSICDIFKRLSPRYRGLNIDHLTRISNDLFKINFFTETEMLPVSPLEYVHFYITRRCNLSCPFCFHDSLPLMSGEGELELGTDAWIKLANDTFKINPEATISISGGEPLVRHDALDILEGISPNGLKLRLITNGTLLTRDLISRLSGIPRLHVQVSIDSIVPEENAKTRGLHSLDRAIEAVLQMKEEGIDVSISSTVTRINEKSVWKMNRFCDQNNIGFTTSPFFITGVRSSRNAPRLGLTPEELLESAVYNSKKFKNRNSSNYAPTPGIRKYHCGAGYGQIAIQPDGSVSPCRLLTDSSYYLGNVKNSEICQLLELGKKRYSAINVDNASCDCAKCAVRYLCAGGCKAHSVGAYGTINRSPPNCRLLNKIYIRSLWEAISDNQVNESKMVEKI